MSQAKHYATKPEDRLSFGQKLAYGIGSLVNNLLGAAIGCMSIVLNLGLGMDPALVGILMAFPRLADALVDPVMGYISDNTRSRFGRRRPYIFVGAIFSGIVFALMWQLPAGHSQNFYFWFFMAASIVFYLAYTVYAAPWVGLGYEMTPDYHERTRLMGVSNWIGQFAWVIAPWFYKIMEYDAWFPDNVAGARGLAIFVGVFVAVAGIVPAIVCRERFAPSPFEAKRKPEGFPGFIRNMKKFFADFLITLKCLPFLNLCAATFLVFNGFMLVSAFSSYIIIYYVFGGNNDMGATYMGWFGMVSSISTFCVIPLVTWLSSKIGKKNAFIISTSISVVGYGLKWFCYNPAMPWMILIPAPLMSFGLGGLFTLMGAMIADVCDLDERKTANRREGMFGAIYWWMVKLGMALAFAMSGHLLNSTGFHVSLGGNQTPEALFLMRIYDVLVPVAASIIAVLIMCKFEITEESAHQVRMELEKRRAGKGEAGASQTA